MKFGQLLLGMLLGGLLAFGLIKYTTNATKSEFKVAANPNDTTLASAEWNWPDSMDAMKAAPDNHKLIYEDVNVRVLMVTLDSKMSEPVHTHKWSSIMWIAKPIVPCRIINYKTDNGKLVKKDSVLINEMPTNVGQLIGPEAPTSITNLGNSNGVAYRVEFKKDFKP